MNRFSTNTLAALIAASLWFAAGNLGHADDQTNATASQHTNGISIKISAGHENSPSDNYFGLPKEAFDRLSPEQITALAQLHKDQNGNISDSIAMTLIPIAMFSMIALCVWLGVNGRQKRTRLLHDTLRLMIEKGQPIPPELLQPADPQRRPRNDLRTGLVLVSIGIGVWFLPLGSVVARAGLIPLLMGVAFIIVWAIEAGKRGQSK